MIVNDLMIFSLLIVFFVGFFVYDYEIIGIKEPLTKLGTVVVIVERMFVPNCSEAIVTNMPQ